MPCVIFWIHARARLAKSIVRNLVSLTGTMASPNRERPFVLSFVTMKTRLPFRHRRWLSFSAICFGLGLLLLMPTAKLAASPAATQTPTPPYLPTATPPTQAGHGKDVFWLSCMPCHGDTGQGLTDEFRFRQYPSDDTNCWKSGCHGNKPYANGFTLPKTVPALIGPGTLQHFNTAQELYAFVRKAMPFSAPGSLTDEQYTQVIAFLLESNQLIPVGSQLNPSALSAIVLRTGSLTPTPAAPDQTSLPASYVNVVTGIVIFLMVATVLSFVTRRRRSRPS